MNRSGMSDNRILSGDISHAYIIEGPAGSERTEFVKKTVQALLCEDRGADHVKPCGICASCRKVERGTHEDVFMMEQTGKTAYRVADAAKLMERLSMRPYGERNIGIIDNADALSETVQNKLLKTLEEPYPGTVIFLEVANRESLLPTVRSRCVTIRMSDAWEDDEAGEELEKARGLLEIYGKKCFFHEYRAYMDSNIRTRECALKFLDLFEKKVNESMVADMALSESSDEAVFMTRLIETTRMNIYVGMGYKPALKKMFLELREN